VAHGRDRAEMRLSVAWLRGEGLCGNMPLAGGTVPLSKRPVELQPGKDRPALSHDRGAETGRRPRQAGYCIPYL